MVAFYDKAKPGKVNKQRPTHDTQPENGADAGGLGNQDQDRSNQFQAACPDPSPWFDAQRGKDIHRLFSPGKFEEKRLEHDQCRQEAQDPEKDHSGSIVGHGNLFFCVWYHWSLSFMADHSLSAFWI